MTKTNITKPQRRHLKYVIPILCIGILCIFSTIFISNADKRSDFKRLNTETYNSVFFSMYDVGNYKEEDFITYRGLQTIIAGNVITSLPGLSSYLEQAFHSGNELNTVYIGFDPYLTYTKSLKKDSFWKESLQKYLFQHIANHPEITFEILLPYPSLDTWQGYSDKKTNTMLATYQTSVALFSSYENVICHFAGAREWLIANPDNYTSDISVNELISGELVKHAFCDRKCTIDISNAGDVFDSLRAQIQNANDVQKEYPDFSDMHIVFFGDSIIGNHSGSYSIPGIIKGLTRANVYNFAVGGTNASRQSPEQDIYPSFITRTEDFLAGTIGQTQDGTEFPYESISGNSEHLCFIIHYGFNDFMWNVSPNTSSQNDVSTFEGALRSGITGLKEAYPNATILLVAPQLCTYYAGGDSIMNENGYTFDDYLAVIEKTANEMQVQLIDMPALINIDATNYTDYYVDSFHHTEQGRFVTANHWINSLTAAK